MRAGLWVWLRAACDTLVAVAAVLTIMASLLPWFEATVMPPNPAGLVMAPIGALTGVEAHASLWAAVGLAVAQIVLLLARYYAGGRLRVPRDGTLLTLGSGLTSLLVTADTLVIPGPWAGLLNAALGIPSPWEGRPVYGDGYTLLMTWRYGATIAIVAALASLAFTIASLVVTKAGTWRSNVALRKHQLAGDLNATS
jgi:hypothetical protein